MGGGDMVKGERLEEELDDKGVDATLIRPLLPNKGATNLLTTQVDGTGTDQGRTGGGLGFLNG